ncbi:MAG: glycoside hydrolase family 127 protein, partial [Clostridiales bacterium]|nr:glycoside hydrolase family 127 protein [Clostridiales bacterium]
MKSFNKFTKLKPGSIKLGGMLKKWAGINTGAWLLEYAVRKHTNIYGKFWNRNKTTDGNYDDNNQTVILCDYTAYFADGMIRYSQLFENSELADEAEKWIGLLLKSQDADGYIGAFEPQARWKHPLEIFSQALVLETLLYKYEATGEDKFLNAIEKAAQLQIKAWNESQDHGIFYGHGAVVIRMFGKLYDLTGKKDYLVFANLVLSICGRIDEFINSGDALMNVHDVVGTEYIGLPAMLYEYCGDENLEKAGRRAWDMMVNNHLSVTGSPHGAEIMLRTGPRENCEHCGTVEWIITSDAMARMCGEVKYADEAEVALYNAYPAAKSPDGMTVTYLHTPNQLVASEWSNPLYYEKPDRWDSRGYYSSAHEPLCCNSNGPRALPFFLESMFVRYCDGLAIMYYGACKVCE